MDYKVPQTMNRFTELFFQTTDILILTLKSNLFRF